MTATQTWLSKLIVNPGSRSVRADLGDSVRLHRRVMSCFEDGLGEQARARLGVLHRLEQADDGIVALYVQSAARPSWDKLPADYLGSAQSGQVNPAVREMSGALSAMATNQTFRFRLRANATRRLGSASARGAGKRVPLSTDGQCIEWLSRQGRTGGFRLLREGDVAAVNVHRECASRGRRHEATVTHATVVFDGYLVVEDAQAFRDVVTRGVGRAKAFGCGLLSLAAS